MTPLKKGNKNMPFRLLLLIGYFFLFATQFNYRYYAVANFFIYGNTTVRANVPPSQASAAQKTEQPTAYRLNTQRPSHLSIDKRFYFRDLIRVGASFSALPPFYTVFQQKYPITSTTCSSSDLPTNGLRGPPAA
jgi:hypothetical protein